VLRSDSTSPCVVPIYREAGRYFAEWHRRPGSSGASHTVWVSGEQEMRRIENRGQKHALSGVEGTEDRGQRMKKHK